MRAQRSAPVLLASSLLIASLVSCSDAASENGRLILIGIDGASPRIVTPMLEEGRLPNLARIRDAGVYGVLRSVTPLYSPRIWNSIVTGKTPKQHGVAGFVYKEGGRRHLYRSGHRRVPALWNILSAAGMRVATINWWTTYPPEMIDGVMVSDHFFPEQVEMIRRTFGAVDDGASGLVYPPEHEALARAAMEVDAPLTSVADPFASGTLPSWANRAGLSRQFSTDTDVTRVALDVQRRISPDVMLVFLPGIDRVSHALWGNVEPLELYPPELQPEPAERAGGAEALRRYYAYTDALIGLLTESYGPDDRVMVVSDHGFEAGVTMLALTGTHDSEAAIDGVIFARGPGVTPGGAVLDGGDGIDGPRPMHVFDVTPTLLAWLDQPVGDDMAGQVAPFIVERTPARIASYDGLEIRRIDPGSTGREADIVEHLEALGYLEEDAGDVEDDAAPVPDPETPPVE